MGTRADHPPACGPRRSCAILRSSPYQCSARNGPCEFPDTESYGRRCVRIAALRRCERRAPTPEATAGARQFLAGSDSRLNAILQSRHRSYPALTQVRDLFIDDFFRRVRNSFGHWSFAWLRDRQRPADRDHRLEDRHDHRDADAPRLEGEALHVASFSVIEALDRQVFARANPRSAGS